MQPIRLAIALKYGAVLVALSAGLITASTTQAATRFNVKLDAADMQGKAVLVFLKPENPQRNYKVHAWQALTGPAGATKSFMYQPIISTDVTSTGINNNPIVSGRKIVQPGQLLSAVSPNSLSPMLRAAPPPLAQAKLTPRQAGVINQTNPFIRFNSNWYVNNKPVVTLVNVGARMTASFEYQPNFYFMVAPPPLIGQTYTLQDFANTTRYALPAGATAVDVRVSRSQGRWTFDFDAK